MKVIGCIWISIVALAALWACSKDQPTDSRELPLQGSYEGICSYTQYQHGSVSKALSQNVEVWFDDSMFTMRKHRSYTGEARSFCDIVAPYSASSVIDIDCPEMQYDCPDWEHPCGPFSKSWKGDSLKLSRDFVDSIGWRHVKSLNLKKLGN